jgi:hypothetical protein
MDGQAMAALGELDLDVLIDHLDRLNLALVERVSISDLEWILPDFLLSWGQRLPSATTSGLTEAERDRLKRVGFTVLPFSTAADFSSVHPDQVRTLALAVTSLNLYVMLLDPIVDDPLATPAAAKLAVEPTLRHFYRSMSQLFPSESPFWTSLQASLDLMSRTMLEEHHRLSRPFSAFTLNEFKRLAQGKMAFARINCIALTTLNGAPELVPALCECWDAISLASIIRDDILDWREDYRNANYTYLLSSVLLSAPFEEEVEGGNLPDLREIGAAVFCTDLIESLYSLAHDELGAAAGRALEIGCLALADVLSRLQATIGSEVTSISERKLERLIAASLRGFQHSS